MPGVLKICAAAKVAAPHLARASTQAKNAALEAMAVALETDQRAVIDANARDLASAQARGVSAALADRLLLTGARLAAMAGALREIIRLPDPVGDVVRGYRLPNGLELRQVRVPLGVIAMIYEGRPNVTVDAASLALKSGNACVLRGSSMAIHSNTALAGLLCGALEAVDLPADGICLITDTGRDSVKELCRARGLVDLLVPRGGAGLIQEVIRESEVPVVETGVGNCHVYVDAAADQAKARAIVVNAKAQRPSVCNAAETLLVHAGLAEALLPVVANDLREAGVTLRGDEAAQRLAGAEPATEQDWDTEYGDYILAVRVVGSLDEALAHIARHGTMHTEAIVTEDRAAARRFVTEVDAAAVMVNASTRFTDGGEFGFGAEIGISTQKTHARGPMGLPELTTTKYIVEGDGHIRT
ncbi:MAG: glutamate-5-semialdehyde dehydrogenase [Egibacteraceae bacterium]